VSLNYIYCVTGRYKHYVLLLILSRSGPMTYMYTFSGGLLLLSNNLGIKLHFNWTSDWNDSENWPSICSFLSGQSTTSAVNVYCGPV